MRIATLTGPDATPLLPALSRLRIAVFADWPYLYDGDAAQEAEYLAAFVASPRAGLVVAFDGETPVGCATCLPLADADRAIQDPFAARGWDPARFFYFGESVLLPAWRGQGTGVAFFTAREAHARAVSDCGFATFCAVRRGPDHPLRPAGATSLHGFWRKRGYAPVDGLACTMSWKQRDSAGETANTLDFWLKPLGAAAWP